MMRRRRITFGIAGGVLALLLVAGTSWAVTTVMGSGASKQEQPRNTPAPTPTPTPEQPATEQPSSPTYDLDSPDSITVVVNKQRALNPTEFEPSDLVDTGAVPNVHGHPIRSVANDALQQMYSDAVAAGAEFAITSGYRDYWLQKEIYDGLVAEGGVEYADLDTARPGHSEHQTGLAIDLYSVAEGCSLVRCFEDTTAGIWLRENSWRYGYILRYHDGEDPVVGYTYEPWHFRYVGTEVSTAMHDRGILNLEDFFGLPAAPTN